ncbi:MAG: hypothetical protein WCT18_04980 [Patescibacteria group bacterium]
MKKNGLFYLYLLIVVAFIFWIFILPIIKMTSLHEEFQKAKAFCDEKQLKTETKVEADLRSFQEKKTFFCVQPDGDWRPINLSEIQPRN